MVAMARKHRRQRNSPGVVQPLYSFRFVVTVLVSFLGLIFCFVSSAWISRFRSKSERSKNNFQRSFKNPDHIPSSLINTLDAILVLGGGAPSALEEPPVYVKQRADDAAKIVQKFQQAQSKSLPILCLSAGTAHVPQLLSPDGLPIWESTSCAAYLRQEHGFVDQVFVETTSYDTIGNAFYTRSSHTDIIGWRRLLIITNDFHMQRTQAIFDWIFLKCSSKNSKNKRTGNSGEKGYELFYLSSEDVGLSEEEREARKSREEQSAKSVEILSKKYTTLPMVWRFLNTEHALYTSQKLIERGRGSSMEDTTSGLVKRSYGLKDGAL